MGSSTIQKRVKTERSDGQCNGDFVKEVDEVVSSIVLQNFPSETNRLGNLDIEVLTAIIVQRKVKDGGISKSGPRKEAGEQ